MAVIAIIILNIVIGIVQEIKARDLVSKLTILSNKPVKVVRNRQEALVPLGILLFLQAFFLRSDTVDVAVIKSVSRSEEHTSELQSRFDLVCRLLLEQKNTRIVKHCMQTSV